MKKRRTSAIDLKRAASICCQCNTCTDLCPRHNLGHPIDPARFMRAASAGDFRDVNPYINSAFCSSCGVCEMYACPQSLAPRSLLADMKGGLRKAGIRPPQGVQPVPVKPSREYRKVPEERLMARLGLTKYDKDAPMDENVVPVSKVKILLSQHIGAPAQAIVKTGDTVTKGQMIAQHADGLSVSIHASISGRVTEVTDRHIIIAASRKDVQNMSKAIGMIEFKTTATGITAADTMVKTSDVEIVEAQTVCPGKYIAIITGDLSAVKAAVDAAVTTYEDKCIDSFVLGNPHESLFPAMYGTTQVEGISALGILETYDAASIIEAADQAAKTAIVDVIELRIAKGMCGKSYMLLTGEVSAVEASIEKAKEFVAEKGMYLDSSVIAHPDKRMMDSLL